VFKAKFFDTTLGFVHTMSFKSLRLLLMYADKQGIDRVWVNQDDQQKHVCHKNGAEWFIYKTTRISKKD
jgi:hypothetical protein